MQSNTTNVGAVPAYVATSAELAAGLPRPDDAALAHSERVGAHIGAHIGRAGGWIPFSTFMRLALHAPGLGYYSAGLVKFGAAGDFHTAPGLSPLFGHALANQFAGVLREVGAGGGILELGAGTGRLAVDALERLASLDTLPEMYAILETSADLRDRQHAAVDALPRPIRDRVTWLDTLPAGWSGVIVGNEVLDALPVELLAKDGSAHLRRGVTLHEGQFSWRDAHLPAGPLREAIDALFPSDSYESEICPEASALTATLGRILRRGMLLWIDYGFPAREYYHPQRDRGTLMCHYRQHAHSDPLLLPGLQDITAHVDFSAIAKAAAEAGLELAGFASQAQFLINCGIVELLGAAGAPGSAEYLRQSNALQRLLSPSEMGELFKAIAFTRGIEQPLRGFSAGDRSASL